MIRGFGPDEGFGVVVGDIDVAQDGVLEFAGASEDTTSELFFGESGEPSLDEIEPRRTGWGEVEVKTRALEKPTLDDLGLVGLIVVEDEVDVEIVRDGSIDGVEEFSELNRTVPFVTFGYDLSALGVESRE